MKNKKNTGSYYTPQYLADFITQRALSLFDKTTTISVLEPSVGDGAFVDSFNRLSNSIKLTASDQDISELQKAKGKWSCANAQFIHTDFLEFKTKEKFDLIIGNPPYIKKNRLTEKQLVLSKAIHNTANLPEKTVKNIWATFVVKSILLLNQTGILAFILPADILQVKYAEEIRVLLKEKFDRIEIFTFDDLMFECKGQDTIILCAYKKHSNKGEFFTNIHSEKMLSEKNFKLIKNNALVSYNMKWTHHFLSGKEIALLKKLQKRIPAISSYCDSKPGIVTAANSYFIVNKDVEQKYNLTKYTQPIIQKGVFVNGSVIFNQNNYKELQSKNYPTRLLQLNDNDKLSQSLSKYLDIGVDLEIDQRYKCKLRDNWYVVPNISTVPEALFFKRCHYYPKLIKNEAKSFVTDSAYKVEMKNEYCVNSLVFSFYNSLTLVFAELEGRYYGGGVLELTPSEFKKLPLPYTSISNECFELFVQNFEKKDSIEDILNKYDSIILGDHLGLSDDEINIIQLIRYKLVNKRMKKLKPYETRAELIAPQA